METALIYDVAGYVMSHCIIKIIMISCSNAESESVQLSGIKHTRSILKELIENHRW